MLVRSTTPLDLPEQVGGASLPLRSTVMDPDTSDTPQPTGAPVVLTATFSCAEVTKEDVFKYLCTDGHNVLLTAFLVVGVECKLIVSEYVSSGDGRAVPLP